MFFYKKMRTKKTAPLFAELFFQNLWARILGDSISERNCPSFSIIIFISISSIILIICEQTFANVCSL